MAHRLMTDGAFNFLFVRNPYSRVFSAYVDKLVAPNPHFWKEFGAKAIAKFRVTTKPDSHGNKTYTSEGKIGGYGERWEHRRLHQRERTISGHDVSFTEFLKWVVNCEQTKPMPDAHIASVKKKCKPCSSPFNYVGKMETFANDAFFIMDKLGMNRSIRSLEHTFKNKSTHDAIVDSIESPFRWRREIQKHISWTSALQRIWLKLQLRGIIDFEQKLNLTPYQVITIRDNEFIGMAVNAHKQSNPEKLMKQKSEVKIEAFRSVPVEVLAAFKEAYMEDFILFGYESTPEQYFKRDTEEMPRFKYFNPDVLK